MVNNLNKIKIHTLVKIKVWERYREYIHNTDKNGLLNSWCHENGFFSNTLLINNIYLFHSTQVVGETVFRKHTLVV